MSNEGKNGQISFILEEAKIKEENISKEVAQLTFVLATKVRLTKEELLQQVVTVHDKLEQPVSEYLKEHPFAGEEVITLPNDNLDTLMEAAIRVVPEIEDLSNKVLGFNLKKEKTTVFLKNYQW
jgi:hypothetical protein